MTVYDLTLNILLMLGGTSIAVGSVGQLLWRTYGSGRVRDKFDYERFDRERRDARIAELEPLLTESFQFGSWLEDPYWSRLPREVREAAGLLRTPALWRWRGRVVEHVLDVHAERRGWK